MIPRRHLFLRDILRINFNSLQLTVSLLDLLSIIKFEFLLLYIYIINLVFIHFLREFLKSISVV